MHENGSASKDAVFSESLGLTLRGADQPWCDESFSALGHSISKTAGGSGSDGVGGIASGRSNHSSFRA